MIVRWAAAVPEMLLFLYAITVATVAIVSTYFVPNEMRLFERVVPVPDVAPALAIAGVGWLIARFTGFIRWAKEWTKSGELAEIEYRMQKIFGSGNSVRIQQRQLRKVVNRIHKYRRRHGLLTYLLEQESRIFEYSRKSGIQIDQHMADRACPNCQRLMNPIPESMSACTHCEVVWIRSYIGQRVIRGLSHEETYHAAPVPESRCVECSRLLKVIVRDECELVICERCECLMVKIEHLKGVVTNDDSWIHLVGDALWLSS